MDYNENQKWITKIRHNRTRPGQGHKYTKYKMCLSTMMIICIKQHQATSEADFMEKLTLFFPMFLFDPPENIRKPVLF